MKPKKDTKAKSPRSNGQEDAETFGKIVTKADLKSFLLSIRDRLADQTVAPIYAVTAIRSVMSQKEIYELLDNENKEIARDVWLRLKQAGLQVRNPPLLFSAEEDAAMIQID